MRTSRTTPLFAAVLILAGCHVDQKAEVDSYRRVLDANTPAPTDYDNATPLSLVSAMALANAHNERLSRGGEDYVQALIDKNRLAAGFFPTFSFQPSYSLQEASRGGNSDTSSGAIPGAGGATGGANNGTGTVIAGSSGYRRLNDRILQRLEAPVVGSINLFRGGADVRNVAAAEANIRARRQLLLDLQATTLLNVAQNYYGALRGEQSVSVLRNSLRVQEARLGDVDQQFANGLAIRLAVAQTRAQVDATRVSLLEAENNARTARYNLALLIGVDRVDGPFKDDYQTPVDLMTLADYEARASKGRPDLTAARETVIVAENQVRNAIAQYYPSISLNVSGFLYREFYADASRWSTILSANLPIFTGGVIQADVRTAWSQLRQAALDESYAKRSALAEVRTDYDDVITADRRIKALADQVSASSEALAQAQNAVANNLAINLDVLTAQDQLLSAQLELTSAQFDRTIFYLELLRAIGALVPNDLAQPATRPTTFPTSLPATPL